MNSVIVPNWSFFGERNFPIASRALVFVSFSVASSHAHTANPRKLEKEARAAAFHSVHSVVHLSFPQQANHCHGPILPDPSNTAVDKWRIPCTPQCRIGRRKVENCGIILHGQYSMAVVRRPSATHIMYLPSSHLGTDQANFNTRPLQY